MKPLIANRFQADRGARIARAWNIAPNLPARPCAAAAGASASAALLPLPESCLGVAPAEQVRTAPDVPPLASGAVVLSDHGMILLRSICAYEQVDDAAAITLALATHAHKIGAGPLARACLDELDRVQPRFSRRTELAADDLTDLPEFPRRAANRFGGGP